MINLILSWIVACFFVVGIADTFRTAAFRWLHGETIRRSEWPTRYWFWTSVFSIVTCLVLVIALMQTFAR